MAGSRFLKVSFNCTKRFVMAAEKVLVCEWCAEDSVDNDTVQLRDCGHVLCEDCACPCLICEDV